MTLAEKLRHGTKTANIPSKHRIPGLEESIVKSNKENPMSADELRRRIDILRSKSSVPNRKG